MVLLRMLREISEGPARSNEGLPRREKTHRSLGRHRVRSLKPRANSGNSSDSSSSSLILSNLSHEIHNFLALPLLMLAACMNCHCKDFCGGGIITGSAMAMQEVHSSCTTAAEAIVVQVGPAKKLCLLGAAAAVATPAAAAAGTEANRPAKDGLLCMQK